MFKVVPDQLRISDGWVRCGHCADVFDASAHLQEDAAPQSGFKPAMQPLQQQPYDSHVASPDLPPHVPSHVAPHKPQYAPPAPSFTDAPPFNAIGQERQGATSSFSDSEVDRNLYLLLADDPAPESSLPVQPVAQPAVQPPLVRVTRQARLDADDDIHDEANSLLSESTLEGVSFVRDARRKAFWRRPAVRAVLSMVALVLLGALGAQVAVKERDRIAAMEPRARPFLQELCARLQCRVEPLRQIESLAIDSSSFSKLRTDTYRLSFTIKNNAPLALAMPAIELALTDSGDQPVLRRVLLPADLGVTTPVLAAGGEWTGTFPLGVSGVGARIVGYRLLAFYP